MSEPATPSEGTPNPPPAPAQAPKWDELFKDEDPQKVKEALDNSRKWEDRAKSNKEKADAFDAAEEARKTEAQKLAERAEAAEAAKTEAEAKLARMQVIADAQIPKDYQDLVQGADEAALKASAEKVAALIKQDGKQAVTGPYVPPEGTGTAGALGGPASDFADHLSQQLGHR